MLQIRIYQSLSSMEQRQKYMWMEHFLKEKPNRWHTLRQIDREYLETGAAGPSLATFPRQWLEEVKYAFHDPNTLYKIKDKSKMMSTIEEEEEERKRGFDEGRADIFTSSEEEESDEEEEEEMQAAERAMKENAGGTADTMLHFGSTTQPVIGRQLLRSIALCFQPAKITSEETFLAVVQQFSSFEPLSNATTTGMIRHQEETDGVNSKNSRKTGGETRVFGLRSHHVDIPMGNTLGRSSTPPPSMSPLLSKEGRKSGDGVNPVPIINKAVNARKVLFWQQGSAVRKKKGTSEITTDNVDQAIESGDASGASLGLVSSAMSFSAWLAASCILLQTEVFDMDRGNSRVEEEGLPAQMQEGTRFRLKITRKELSDHPVPSIGGELALSYWQDITLKVVLRFSKGCFLFEGGLHEADVLLNAPGDISFKKCIADKPGGANLEVEILCYHRESRKEVSLLNPWEKRIKQPIEVKKNFELLKSSYSTTNSSGIGGLEVANCVFYQHFPPPYSLLELMREAHGFPMAGPDQQTDIRAVENKSKAIKKDEEGDEATDRQTKEQQKKTSSYQQQQTREEKEEPFWWRKASEEAKKLRAWNCSSPIIPLYMGKLTTPLSEEFKLASDEIFAEKGTAASHSTKKMKEGNTNATSAVEKKSSRERRYDHLKLRNRHMRHYGYNFLKPFDPSSQEAAQTNYPVLHLRRQ